MIVEKNKTLESHNEKLQEELKKVGNRLREKEEKVSMKSCKAKVDRLHAEKRVEIQVKSVRLHEKKMNAEIQVMTYLPSKIIVISILYLKCSTRN